MTEFQAGVGVRTSTSQIVPVEVLLHILLNWLTASGEDGVVGCNIDYHSGFNLHCK